MSDDQRDSLLRLVEAQTLLSGRFSDIRRIENAGGHFSLLCSAHDSVSGSRVALKFFDPFKRGETYRLDSFHREATVLTELLGQPDILRIVSPIDSFTQSLKSEGGISVDVEFEFFAAELAASSSLEAIALEAWSPEEILVSFRSMCRAAQRIHSRSYVHRDIKPGNFLVMQDGSVKLSDFGTSRSVSDTSVALLPSYSIWPGDYGYASPEALAGLHEVQKEIARYCDLFALGCVLYQLFTGVRLTSLLFDSEFVNDFAVMMSHVPTSERKRVFHETIGSLRDSHALPTVGISGSRVPASIRGLIDELVESLSDLDYRRRTRSFDSIFRKLNCCQSILRNEARYQAWQARKRGRRLARLASD